MAKGAVRKRCIECKRVMTGSTGVMQWCDCGGEMRAIPYSARRRKVRRAS